VCAVPPTREAYVSPGIDPDGTYNPEATTHVLHQVRDHLATTTNDDEPELTATTALRHRVGPVAAAVAARSSRPPVAAAPRPAGADTVPPSPLGLSVWSGLASLRTTGPLRSTGGRARLRRVLRSSSRAVLRPCPAGEGGGWGPTGPTVSTSVVH